MRSKPYMAAADCFAPDCPVPALHELLGLRACTPHYIEALEHSAHIVLKSTLKRLKEDRAYQDVRLGRMRNVLANRARDKKRKETETGRAADYSAPEIMPPAGETGRDAASPSLPAQAGRPEVS